MSAAVFAISLALLLYVLFGYPLLLGWLAGRRKRPVGKAWQPRRVTVLIAAHNAERWIARKLESVAALDYPRELLDVIVVSDGSTDATGALVRACGDPRVVLLEVPRGGKAAALNAGMAKATGDILFFTDVRQRLDAASLRHLVSSLADPRVGVVSGELVIVEGDSVEEANVGLYWKYEKWIRHRQSTLDSVPGATGCIYAMRRELAVPLPAQAILDDVYQPMQAFFRGYRVVLDGDAKAFDEPTGLHAEFRRKVRTLAGVYQILGWFPDLFGRKNRIALHFFSHKVGRLLLPFALLAVLGASFGLTAPWNRAALWGQAAFYAAALLDTVLPDGWRLKRITSPVRTFVVMMAAALCATAILFVPAERLWRAPASGR